MEAGKDEDLIYESKRRLPNERTSVYMIISYCSRCASNDISIHVETLVLLFAALTGGCLSMCLTNNDTRSTARYVLDGPTSHGGVVCPKGSIHQISRSGSYLFLDSSSSDVEPLNFLWGSVQATKRANLKSAITQQLKSMRHVPVGRSSVCGDNMQGHPYPAFVSFLTVNRWFNVSSREQ
ncbi:hypothetical protein HD806DRAFT_36457 [Xylariaceae sp. AK1471]|nr:hypothetical protein HD806DRAFT_36457 [Xylariaceae sp. AK1471]